MSVVSGSEDKACQVACRIVKETRLHISKNHPSRRPHHFKTKWHSHGAYQQWRQPTSRVNAPFGSYHLGIRTDRIQTRRTARLSTALANQSRTQSHLKVLRKPRHAMSDSSKNTPSRKASAMRHSHQTTTSAAPISPSRRGRITKVHRTPDTGSTERTSAIESSNLHVIITFYTWVSRS